MILRGSYPALVTPFRDGTLDLAAARSLVEHVIACGSAGIVPVGCTGEAAALTLAERELLIGTVVDVVTKRVPVIVGTGTNNTRTTIELSHMAAGLGADAVMLITPYYNKPTQEGLFQHYRAVAEKIKLPIIIYNVPGRTGVSIAPETVARIAEIEHVVGIKEASGSLDQVTAILARCNITVLSGDDSLTLPMLAVGAKGVISTVANVAPTDMADLVSSYLSGDSHRARELHFKLFPLIKAMFIETNPCPVKRALEFLGRITGELRLPLVPVSDASSRLIRDALTSFGLLREVV